MYQTRLDQFAESLMGYDDSSGYIPNWDGILGWHDPSPKPAYLRHAPKLTPLPFSEHEAFSLSSESLIRGLWIDTFNRTDHASLFYQPRTANHILFPGASSIDCKDEWRTLTESDLPAIRSFRNSVARWHRGQFTTEEFLGRTARRIAHYHRGMSAQFPLAMSLGSQARWDESAEVLERMTVELGGKGLGVAAASIVTTCYLNLGRTAGLERVARRSMYLTKKGCPELLFLVAAVRLSDWSMIHEAAYRLDENYTPECETIVNSATRRARRIKDGLHDPLRVPWSRNRMEVGKLGAASRAALLWT